MTTHAILEGAGGTVSCGFNPEGRYFYAVARDPQRRVAATYPEDARNRPAVSHADAAGEIGRVLDFVKAHGGDVSHQKAALALLCRDWLQANPGYPVEAP